MELSKTNFERITTNEMYKERRFALQNSMILFFCYSPDDSDIDDSWLDFLNEINEKYNKFVAIKLVSKTINKLS